MENIGVNILEKIGLTKGEIKAYLALLRIGPSSTGPLAKESRVSRSKLYLIMDKLEKRGLASHADHNGIRYFQVVEPKKIKDYLMEKKDELERVEKEFDEMLPRLEAGYKSRGAAQNVTIYLGLKGMQTAHEHTYMKLKQSDEYLVLGAPQYQPWMLVKPNGPFLNYWNKDHQRRIAAGIKCRMLFNPDAEKSILKEKNSFRLCVARYLPIDIKTPVYFTIYQDTVLITTLSAEPLSIEIVSQEVTDAFKRYFEEFWKMSKPFGTR